MSARYINSPSADDTTESEVLRSQASGTSTNVSGGALYSRARKRFSSSRKPFYGIKAIFAFVLLVIFSASSAAPALAAMTGNDLTASPGIDAINSPNFPDAGMLCSGIGYGMNSIGGSSATGGAGFGNTPTLPSLGNRKWTIDEAYGGGLGFTQWNGTGNGLFFSGVHTGGSSSDDDDEASGDASALGNSLLGRGNASSQPHLMEEVGAGCVLAFITSGVPSAILHFSSFIVEFSILIAGFAFDPTFICNNPSNPEGNCINLLGILAGGGGSGDGIIGALTNSIYFPLLAVAFLFVAMSLIWTGIVKREFRRSFQNIGWSLIAMVLGVVFLTSPMMLAGIPQQITSIASGCIIGAFNGDNCFTGNSISGESVADGVDADSGRECTSSASGANINQTIQLTVNSLGCSVYKAFVLNAWSQAQFGRGYDAMSVNDPRTADAISEAGMNKSDFRVSLYSSRSHNAQINNNSRVEGYPYAYVMAGNADSTDGVSNVAAYQLALGSSTHNPDGHGASTGAIGALAEQDGREYDSRWFNVAVVAANDAEMWDAWSSSGTHRMGAAVLGVITAALGTLVIFITSLFALVYLVTSILLMAFAPLFFLFAIEPTRGRRIFLGWVESAGSNILKYIASAFFLIVTLALFAAVLGSAEGIATAFIFVLIITAALLMYRKTIVELIGRANMGGERMQSDMMDRVKNRFNIEDPNSAVRRMGSSVAGGAIGGGAAGAVANYKDRRDTGEGRIRSAVLSQGAGLKHSVAGAGGAVGRELQSKTGVLGDATREASRRAQQIGQSKNESIQDHQAVADQESADKQRQASASAQVAGDAEREIEDDYEYQDAQAQLNGVDADGNVVQNVASNGDTQDQKDVFAHGEDARNVATEREVEQDVLAEVQASDADPDEKKAVTDEVAMKLEIEDKTLERAGLEQQLTEARRNGDGDEVKRIEAALDVNAEHMSEVKHDLHDLRNGVHAGAINNFRGEVDSRLRAKGADANDDYTYAEGGHFDEFYVADKARIKNAADKLNGNAAIAANSDDIAAHIDNRVEAHSAGVYKDTVAQLVAEHREKNNGADPGPEMMKKIKADATEEAAAAGDAKRSELLDHYGAKSLEGLDKINATAQVGDISAAVEGYNVSAVERLGNNDIRSKKLWSGEDGATYATSPEQADGSRDILRKGAYDEGFRKTGLKTSDPDFGSEGSAYGSKEEFFEAMADVDEKSRQARGLPLADPSGGATAGESAVPSDRNGSGGLRSVIPPTSADTPGSAGGTTADGVGGADASRPSRPGDSLGSSTAAGAADELGIDPETGDPIETDAQSSGSAGGRSAGGSAPAGESSNRNARRLSNALDEDEFDRQMGSSDAARPDRSQSSGGSSGSPASNLGDAIPGGSNSAAAGGSAAGGAARADSASDAQRPERSATRDTGDNKNSGSSDNNDNRGNNDNKGDDNKGDNDKGGGTKRPTPGGGSSPLPGGGAAGKENGSSGSQESRRGGLGGAMNDSTGAGPGNQANTASTAHTRSRGGGIGGAPSPTSSAQTPSSASPQPPAQSGGIGSAPTSGAASEKPSSGPSNITEARAEAAKKIAEEDDSVEEVAPGVYRDQPQRTHVRNPSWRENVSGNRTRSEEDDSEDSPENKGGGSA